MLSVAFLVDSRRFFCMSVKPFYEYGLIRGKKSYGYDGMTCSTPGDHCLRTEKATPHGLARASKDHALSAIIASCKKRNARGARV